MRGRGVNSLESRRVWWFTLRERASKESVSWRVKTAAHTWWRSRTNTGAATGRRRQHQISGFTLNLSTVFAATGSFFPAVNPACVRVSVSVCVCVSMKVGEVSVCVCVQGNVGQGRCEPHTSQNAAQRCSLFAARGVEGTRWHPGCGCQRATHNIHKPCGYKRKYVLRLGGLINTRTAD